jgi:hypothetical protein
MKDSQALQVQPGSADAALVEQQARFDVLVRDVAHWRERLAEWEERMVRFDQRVEPVRRELHSAWRQWVLALDVASLQPGLSRAERGQLGELLRDAATALLEVEGADAEIASVLGRHQADAVAQVDSGGNAEPDATPDWEATAAAAAAQREQRAASRRAAKARERHAAAAQDASQSVREVYRKLASALHPDREPEPQQRQRKTALMQQANQAHAEGNLLALLELQVQAEQLDMAQLAPTDQRRLEHFVAVLQDQLARLQAETRALESAFREMAGLPAGSGLQPRKADRVISSEAQRLREELLLLRQQTRLLLDVEATREWLRELRRA